MTIELYIVTILTADGDEVCADTLCIAAKSSGCASEVATAFLRTEGRGPPLSVTHFRLSREVMLEVLASQETPNG